MWCPAYGKKHDTNKLEFRTELCRFVYMKGTFGYYFYLTGEKTIFITKRSFYWKINISREEIMGVK